MSAESQVAFWKATKFWLTLLLAGGLAALVYRMFDA